MTKDQLREAIRAIIKKELTEAQPAVAPPKPGTTTPTITPKKPGRLGNPAVAPKPKATMTEADMLAKIIKRFRSAKPSLKENETVEKYSYVYNQPNKDQGDYTIVIRAYPDPKASKTKEQIIAMVDKYKNDPRAPMRLMFFKSEKDEKKARNQK